MSPVMEHKEELYQWKINFENEIIDIDPKNESESILPKDEQISNYKTNPEILSQPTSSIKKHQVLTKSAIWASNHVSTPHSAQKYQSSPTKAQIESYKRQRATSDPDVSSPILNNLLMQLNSSMIAPMQNKRWRARSQSWTVWYSCPVTYRSFRM